MKKLLILVCVMLCVSVLSVSAQQWCSFHSMHTTYSDGNFGLEESADSTEAFHDCGSTNDHDTQLSQTEWDNTVAISNARNIDGNFTYFFGTEWTGNQHVHYVTMNPSLTRQGASDSAFNEVVELTSWLASNEGVGQHNHPARDSGGTDFSIPTNYDENVITLVEMVNQGQYHWNLNWDCEPGVCTTYQNPKKPSSNADHKGWIKYALDQGIHLGFSGGNDDHSSPLNPTVFTGIVNSASWGRQGVFDELKARHTWAAEDKIEMSVYANGSTMGDIFEVTSTSLSIFYNITAASGTIDDVNLFYDGIIVEITNFSGVQSAVGNFVVDFADFNEHYIFLEAIQSDGKRAWSSPMYVTYIVAPECGNNLSEPGEVCDGTDLGGESCQSRGFDFGDLYCLGDCSGFDESGCGSYVCGNNIKEPGEDCDGSDLGGETCESLGGYIGGNLSCSGCSYDTSNCEVDPCGDGYCDGLVEDCNVCSADCISGEYVICSDGICHGTNYGETGETCGLDCPYEHIPGGTCDACWKGVCDGDCHPVKEDSTCVDCNPGETNICGDLSCTGSENVITCPVDCGGSVPPVYTYCCGDGSCEGDEDENNCLTDCGCTLNSECDDSDECTDDVCNLGVCENNPLADNSVCAGGVCCGGGCTVPSCSADIECDDSETCTSDSCVNPGTCSASCSNSWPSCGIADSCCGPLCDYSNDVDCVEPDCSACFKGECDGTCHPVKEGPDCPDCQ